MWWRWYLRKYDLHYAALVPILDIPFQKIANTEPVTEALLDFLGITEDEITAEQKTALKNAGTEIMNSTAGDEPIVND